MLDFLIVGITVLVVAIPEGLPLAVTISLAYSVKKMLQENNLVKRLAACETMGGADMICSDKTGTLTTNQMKALQFWLDGTLMPLTTSADFATYPEYFAKLKESICMTTSARVQDGKEFGSKTEIALLNLLDNSGHADYLEVRETYMKRPYKVFPFSSNRKKSSVIITVGTGEARVHLSGASEYVLDSCVSYLGNNGEPKPLTPEMKAQILSTIEKMASSGLRTISLAYKDIDPSCNWVSLDSYGNPEIERSNFICIGVVGIADPVRHGVPRAVAICTRAGMRVRMVTGDNRNTAKAIALQCGILLNGEEGVMEGKEFNEQVGGIVCKHCRTHTCPCGKDPRKLQKNQQLRIDVVQHIEQFEKLMPTLDVLARSQPEHKYVLVTGLMQLSHVVAVTGDGTNDAPALKKADVGFAMGNAGTEHAKEAADIILLDDNFESIVSATKWGRNIYGSIRKFIQFQLTVNVVAVSAAIVGAITIKQSPLTAVQMLWVNLIMDTFASLALATEKPTDDLLNHPPHSRSESIISANMWKHILGQALLQGVVLYLMIFAGEEFLIEDGDSDESVRKNGDFVVSGRMFKFDGEEDYKEYYDNPDIGPSRHFTIIFNTFVLMQLFNEFNARSIHEEKCVFSGLLGNMMFVYIWLFTLCMQVAMVHLGGYAVSCHFQGLTLAQWGICVGLGLLVLPWRFVLLAIPSRGFNRLETSTLMGGSLRLTATLRRSIHTVHGF